MTKKMVTKQRAWMPLYIGDYRKDTGHLSTIEHGAYLLLIMHYWATGGLPNDAKELRRITGFSAYNWKKFSPCVLKFFFKSGPNFSRLKHRRIDKELSKMAEISKKRRAAAEQMHLQKHTHSHSHSHSHKNSSSGTDKTDTKMDAKDWFASQPKPSPARLAAYEVFKQAPPKALDVDTQIEKFTEFNHGKRLTDEEWRILWDRWCEQATAYARKAMA